MTVTATNRTLVTNASLPVPARLGSLLVPVDLSPNSDRVLSRVALLPLADDADLTLLHVVPESLAVAEQREAARDADQALAEEARHLRNSLPKNVRIKTLVKVGSSAKEIGATATQRAPELIVMGRGGGRTLRDALLGSNAERVIRHAKLPVLVVRRPARTAYRRPALALDLDHAAHEVVRLMLRVLPLPRPPVDVVHAYEIPYQGMIYPSLTHDEIATMKAEFQLRANSDLTKLLSTGLAAANIPVAQAPYWRKHVHHGPPRSVVEKAVKKANTDLLVLGTRSNSGSAFVFLGTVAGDLLREVNCDVLVVPPRKADES
jgi:nucleotide-binding universal stress UspA family protein